MRDFFSDKSNQKSRIFRCVVRYGYNDVIGEPNEFEQQLVEQLKQFIRDQNVTNLGGVGGADAEQTNNNLLVSSQQQSNNDCFVKDGQGSFSKPASTSSYQGVDVSCFIRFYSFA